MSPESDSTKRVTAGKKLDAEGQPKAFLLRNRHEEITLEPGKTWAQLDIYKWVTRGLIEEPAGFHVLANGSVQLHGEQVELEDPNGVAQLEEKVNHRFTAPAAKPAPPAILAHTPVAKGSGPNKVRFKVRLDKMGHFMVACFRADERVETGVRGLPTLVRNGLMLKPRDIHVDPLLSYVEIDGTRFDSTPAGAEALENRLNNSYAPVLKGDGHAAVEIRPNSAAASGFDIHFSTFRAGARFEVKGHLCQEQLDALQDQVKCQLLRPGIVLRISPPHLIIRRRRPDGGEERIPELPDIHYLRITAAELQKILNHPLLRRGPGAATCEASSVTEAGKLEIIELHIVRNPQSKALLAMEMVTPRGRHAKALTHHNVAELQHTGVFRANIHVALSIDNRTLSILDQESRHEERIVLDPTSADGDLQKAAQMLTSALKPVAHLAMEEIRIPVEQSNSPSPAIGEPEPAIEPAAIPAETAPGREPAVQVIIEPVSGPQVTEQRSVQQVSPIAVPEAETHPELRALFSESDPVRTNIEVFRRLESCLGVQPQQVRLSLERVFEDRHFEIISFTHPDISTVLEIRSEEFIGFYLSHINEHRVLLDYAHLGKRIEWGPKKCLLQASVTSDPDEFNARGLLGMALTENNQYVFIVTPAFKQWAKSREKWFQQTGASFMTIDDLAGAPEACRLVWPVP
jgi:hypothetical protein